MSDRSEHRRNSFFGTPEAKRYQATIAELRTENDRLRALLVRYQAANYVPEDSDLYAETSRALEGKT
jgi:hypothetical protein